MILSTLVGGVLNQYVEKPMYISMEDISFLELPEDITKLIYNNYLREWYMLGW